MAEHLEVVYTTQLIDEIADAVDINKMRAGKKEAMGSGDGEQVKEFGLKSFTILLRKGET